MPDREDETIEELRADNRRLRQLLEERRLPSELRHRLRGTLALLRSIILQSRQKTPEVEDFSGRLLDRLDAIAWAQSAADEFGAVDLHTLIAERLIHFSIHEGSNLTLGGPEISLSPRSGQYLSLAVQELASNAIEHGSLGAGHGALSVEWNFHSVGENDLFKFIWTETGAVTAVAVAGEAGMGTATLIDMLKHEFDAATTIDHGSNGYKCQIEFPWQQRFGSAHA